MEYTIYLIENEVNGKKYVGMTCQSLDRRMSCHLSAARTGLDYARHRAIRKHGEENFSIRPLDEAKTEEEACQLEREWIERLDTYEGRGYNESAGGEPRHNTKYDDERVYHCIEAFQLYEVRVSSLADETGVSESVIRSAATGRGREDLYERFAENHPRYTGKWSKVDDRLYEAARYALLNDDVSRREAAEEYGFSVSQMQDICCGQTRPYIRQRFDKEYDYEPEWARSEKLGERNPAAKLTEQDVLDLRREYVEDEDLTTADLTDRTGLSFKAILNLMRGDTWDHLPVPDEMPEVMAEKSSKGPTGRDNASASLTEDQVLEIRHRYEQEDTSYRALGDDYSVCPKTISKIINRKTWTHI